MVQDNYLCLGKGIVCGMYFQIGVGVVKLVCCVCGLIVDVMVDLCKGFFMFGEWEVFEFIEDNMCMVYCLVGFVYGFCVIFDVVDVMYKQSYYYVDEIECGIVYNDFEVGIEWLLLVEQLIFFKCDVMVLCLSEIVDDLLFVYGVMFVG